jgi:hypothetical protein
VRGGIVLAGKKTVKLAAAFLLFTFLTSVAALAEDYTVDFGAETKAGRESGTLHCRLNEFCDAKMQSLKLRISLQVLRSYPSEADVYLFSSELSCCYFANDRIDITVYPREQLSPLPFFKGAGRGNLYIEKERAGTLYLRFHFRQDDNDESEVTRPPTWQLSNEDLYRRQIPGSPR